jgi:eukaryotic-like serine/threonine-protein kinase
MLSSGATRTVASSGVDDMTSRSESARNVIRVNATSIDVTSSDTISFGYVSELARAGRIIAGRHRLHSPLPAASGRKPSSTCSSLWRAEPLRCGKVAMAEVAMAEAVMADAVMVELLDPAIAEDPSLADLFANEARAAAAVKSPFVSRVLDFGIEGSTPYLVSELGTGETLAARIAARQKPRSVELVRVVGELARALDAMHAAGVLHRDLRSERVNLWRTPTPLSERNEVFERNEVSERNEGDREVAKLSFGISKLMNETLDLVRTMAHRAIGPADSPYYASPEQILADTPLGPESDLWSLAVIAFEWVTGELPFVGATIGERLVQICAGSARVPSEVCEVPRGFDAWFARGVRKAAPERWRSGREMAEALAAIVR